MSTRCPWCLADPLYIAYHDNEWGVPSYDDRYLFAMLCLEGMQAGLSWLTILKRRANYSAAFAEFDAKQVAKFDEQQVQTLMHNTGIIRHRAKILAIIQNARAYLKITKEQSFSTYLWNIVGAPIDNRPSTMHDIPTKTSASHALAKRLKEDGFVFVGPTTCYAFMQAVGMVNDHLITCPTRHPTQG